ncbi:acyl carrier protein [Methylicorpusculum oleiharenae]|uniref:acyl carrier protein n=1 Tax=Methylicorpusculum oleiharenae TaxID=1338687 RepID=UPI001356C587|nr:acyl carrier protein [Methylicorpusculum oleiharenae]MCD2451466.1 acyl carrier protein [Methylicorpusculum oleiharenae]
MQLEEIKEEIKNIFADRLNMDLSSVTAGDDDGLFDDGWGIDSIDVIDIVLGVEKKFGVKLGQDEEIQGHFRSLNTLAAYVKSLTETAKA